MEITEEQRSSIQQLELRILCEVDRICRKYDIKYSLAYGTMLGAVRHKGFIPWDDDVDILLMRKDYIKLKTVCQSELGEEFFYQSNDTDSECFYLYDKIRLNGTVFKENHVADSNIHQGVYIDIFPIDYLPSSCWKRNIQYYAFHFCRTGVQAKFMTLAARTGIKKMAAAVLRVLYYPFSLLWLYKKAHWIAMGFDSDNSPQFAGNFFSPYKKKDVYDLSVFQEWSTCSFEGHEMGILTSYDKMLRQLYGDYMELPPEKDRTTRHSLVEIKL